MGLSSMGSGIRRTLTAAGLAAAALWLAPAALAAAGPIGAPILFTALADEVTADVLRDRVPAIARQPVEDKFRATAGWECVRPFYDPEVRGSAGRRVAVSIGLAPLAGDQWVIDAAVEFRPSADRHITRSSTNTWQLLREGDRLTEDQVQTLALTWAQDLGDLVDDLSANGVRPCQPTLKVQGKTKLSAQRVDWENSFEGEGKLSLAQDGSFTGGMPIARAWTPFTVAGPQGTMACSFSGGAEDAIDINGYYDDADGALKFTRMAFEGVRGERTATCAFLGMTVSVGGQLPSDTGGDAALHDDLRLRLEHGALASFPARSPAPGVSHEFSLDLTYDTYGEEVGAS